MENQPVAGKSVELSPRKKVGRDLRARREKLDLQSNNLTPLSGKSTRGRRPATLDDMVTMVVKVGPHQRRPTLSALRAWTPSRTFLNSAVSRIGSRSLSVSMNSCPNPARNAAVRSRIASARLPVRR